MEGLPSGPVSTFVLVSGLVWVWCVLGIVGSRSWVCPQCSYGGGQKVGRTGFTSLSETRKGYVIVEIVSAAPVDWRCNRRHSRMLRPITVRPDAVRPPSSRRVVSIRWKWCIWA